MNNQKNSRTTKHKNAFKPKTTKKKSQPSLLFSSSSKIGDVERKNTDTANTGIVAPAGGTFRNPAILLNGLSTGTTATTRIGRRITMKSIQMRYTVEQSAGSGPSQLRHLCVYDKQTNGATPVTTDILQADRFDSPMNLTNANRFVILFDEISDSRSSTNLNISGQVYKKMSLDTVYSTSTGTVSDIQTGAVWYLIASNDANGGTQVTPVDSYLRIRFVDV